MLGLLKLSLGIIFAIVIPGWIIKKKRESIILYFIFLLLAIVAIDQLYPHSFGN